MTDWQPIETAPKDGTRILVYGKWRGELYGPTDDDAAIYVAIWGGDGWMVEGSEYYSPWVDPATHWQPLPEPPQ